LVTKLEDIKGSGYCSYLIQTSLQESLYINNSKLITLTMNKWQSFWKKPRNLTNLGRSQGESHESQSKTVPNMRSVRNYPGKFRLDLKKWFCGHPEDKASRSRDKTIFDGYQINFITSDQLQVQWKLYTFHIFERMKLASKTYRRIQIWKVFDILITFFLVEKCISKSLIRIT